MKKSHLMLCLALALPAVAQINVAQANVSVDLNVPGGSIHIGDKNSRGDYWDGYDWRTAQWWRNHQNKHMGERNNRGMYWHGNRWEAAPPPKHDAGRPHQQPQHAQPHGEPNHGNDRPQDNGRPQDKNGPQGNQGHGQPVPPQDQHHN